MVPGQFDSVNLETPSVENWCVCIATEMGLPLAAMISSYFNSASKYFAVFEFPRRALLCSSTDSQFCGLFQSDATIIGTFGALP